MAFLSVDRFLNRQSARKGFLRLLESVNHLLWPTICLGCRTRKDDLDTFLCGDCWRDLMAACGGDYCPHCGRQASRFGRIGDRCGDCQDRQLAFDGIARAGVYGGTLRQIILSMKFQDRGELAKPLTRILNAALQSAPFADSIDWFVPVPLHWRRRLSRGFNQSRMLAKRPRSSVCGRQHRPGPRPQYPHPVVARSGPAETQCPRGVRRPRRAQIFRQTMLHCR